MRSSGYRPNTVARALATGRTRTVGVVALATALHGPTSTLLAVEAAAASAGYHLSIVRLRPITRRSIAEAARGLQEPGVDGIIIIAPHTWAPKALRDVLDGVPLVAVEGGAGPLPTAAVDQERGAALAMDHLLSLGHATVWHVAGPKDWLEAQARERAWRQALLQSGRPQPPALPGGWGVRSGYDAGRRLLAEKGVTAVFVANDQMALGVLRAFHEAGVEVPGQVSLVGFDDVPEAAYFTPPLTTVRQDFQEVGRPSAATPAGPDDRRAPGGTARRRGAAAGRPGQHLASPDRRRAAPPAAPLRAAPAGAGTRSTRPAAARSRRAPSVTCRGRVGPRSDPVRLVLRVGGAPVVVRAAWSPLLEPRPREGAQVDAEVDLLAGVAVDGEHGRAGRSRRRTSRRCPRRARTRSAASRRSAPGAPCGAPCPSPGPPPARRGGRCSAARPARPAPCGWTRSR